MMLSGGCDGLGFGNISLRQWLDKPKRQINKLECLHVFSQVVEIVNAAHSRGIVVSSVRPSRFSLSPFHCASFIESASYFHLGSDSMEDRLLSEDFRLSISPRNELSDISCAQSDLVNENESGEVRNWCNSEQLRVKRPYRKDAVSILEPSWYTSPEEVAGAPRSFASDIYCLGVLLFELFCHVRSREEKSRTMSSLRHRVFPPQLLMEWPKEASFCLWLLHPEPNKRPRISELLQSEFLNQLRRNSEGVEDAGELREQIEEQELLLEFLSHMHDREREAAAKLQNVVSFLCSDIEEVRKHRTVVKEKGDFCSDFPSAENVDGDAHSAKTGLRKRLRTGFPYQLTEESDNESVFSQSSRMSKNFKKLEAAYLSTRCGPIKQSETRVTEQRPVSSISTVVSSGRSSVNDVSMKDDQKDRRRSGWIEPFLEGLCKYVAFSKLKVRAELNQGDLLNSSNLVCSLSFDRDGELFAAGGVNKKIKVFECDAILEEDRDIHYPIIEMTSRSKICCVCWNTYIKQQVASSNFEGVVQVWDVTSNEALMEMREHEKRVWSVDISSADPTMLASGSDDGSVKLWCINQSASIATIKTKANVCSVQFAPDSGRSLAFGSADHKIYYYDLRNSRFPLCTLVGHNQTISYVKFLDSTTLVSSSTDNTVKLWDMSLSQSRVLDSPLRTFSGHVNARNFVGLSISNGYIATGSETNEVHVYHKAFPMPALSFNFDATDLVSGNDLDETSHFISSVCWRGQSSTLVAANSTGSETSSEDDDVVRFRIRFGNLTSDAGYMDLKRTPQWVEPCTRTDEERDIAVKIRRSNQWVVVAEGTDRQRNICIRRSELGSEYEFMRAITPHVDSTTRKLWRPRMIEELTSVARRCSLDPAINLCEVFMKTLTLKKRGKHDERFKALASRARRSTARWKPAAPSSLRALKTAAEEELDTDDCCPICTAEYGSSSEAALIMPCSHKYHRNCISQWLLRNHVCPVCRFEMPRVVIYHAPEPHSVPPLHRKTLAV